MSKRYKYDVGDHVRVKTLKELESTLQLRTVFDGELQFAEGHWVPRMRKYCESQSVINQVVLTPSGVRYYLDITTKHYFTEYMLKDIPYIDLKDSMEFKEELL